MYSNFFYKTFWVEIRQALFSVFVSCNAMFHCLKSSVGWSNVDCLFYHFAILWHGSISTVFHSSFSESFAIAIELVLVTLSIVATIEFATQAQLFLTPEFFFEKSRLSLMMLLVSSTICSWEEVAVAFAVKLSEQSHERTAHHSFLFFGRILSSKFFADRAKYRESVSISSSYYFSVLQPFKEIAPTFWAELFAKWRIRQWLVLYAQFLTWQVQPRTIDQWWS